MVIALIVYPYVRMKFYLDLVNEMFDLRIYRNKGKKGGGPNDSRDGSLHRRTFSPGLRKARAIPSILNLNSGLRDK